MAGKTMRAVDIKNGTGPATALFINPDVARPQIEPHQCLVRVKAFGLNRMDILQREGKYPVPPQAPRILGIEFSGTIEEAGSDASAHDAHHWKAGDEVFGLAYGGAYAELIAVSRRMLMRKPPAMSHTTAAGVCEVYFTALQALHLIGGYSPATTHSVLWHAGASAVSIAGTQLALAANHHTAHAGHADKPPPRVFTTTRDDAKCELSRKMGATGSVNTRSHPKDWPDQIKALNDGNGIDLLVDFVGADTFQGNLDVMNKDGHIVQLGVMSGTKLPAGTDISAFVMKRVRFEGSTLRSRDEKYQSKLRDLFEEKVMPEMLAGKFDPNIETVESWTKITDMHLLLEGNKTKGKIVCLVD